MRVWIDPKETAEHSWGGNATGESTAADAPTPVKPVMERALATHQPVQYGDGAFVTPAQTRDEDGVTADGYARIQFNCAATRPGTIKLTARGYRWGGDEEDMRFKSLFSRESDPTPTVPVGTYERWLRRQHGDVRGYEEGNEYIDFRPTAGSTAERRDRREWESLWRSVRLRLAELELVRNAPFARYVLQERGQWDTIRGILRWKPTAFAGANGE
ncbi:MAG: hypothetical protein ABEJ73_00335 [Haloplanus sp.]